MIHKIRRDGVRASKKEDGCELFPFGVRNIISYVGNLFPHEVALRI
jgi:hypothetical protein